MLKILQINSVYGRGSTGRIAQELHDLCVEKGHRMQSAYRYAEATVYEDTWCVSSWLDCHIHNRLSRYTMKAGLYSRRKTRRFLRKVKAYAPDVIHLHNLHGSYIHFPTLFAFIKKHQIPVVWTLHDCWSFTGFCPHFDMIGCDRWQKGCGHCPLKKKYRECLVDSSAYVYQRKAQAFGGCEGLTLVTPSQWLADLTRKSFLKEYPVQVIHNGIDLTLFHPTESDFRQKYCCEDKKIILGVAFGWSERKGLDVFVELSKRLDDTYRIVLVGTSESLDAHLPPHIISIHRTHNQQELAEIYTAADLFVNPTREENYPTVHMEALACGTPVLSFDTGGCKEMLDDTCGFVVPKGDIDAMEKEIIRICETKPYSAEACSSHARNFDMHSRFEEYVHLYESVVETQKGK